MMIAIPVAVGEVADKISILQLKQKHITDKSKLANIVTEVTLLIDALNHHIATLEAGVKCTLIGLQAELYDINSTIWQIEDGIRDCERNKDFGEKFIEFARGVYFNNDKRAEIKRKISILLDSGILEEKSYAKY